MLTYKLENETYLRVVYRLSNGWYMERAKRRAGRRGSLPVTVWRPAGPGTNFVLDLLVAQSTTIGLAMEWAREAASRLLAKETGVGGRVVEYAENVNTPEAWMVAADVVEDEGHAEAAEAIRKVWRKERCFRGSGRRRRTTSTTAATTS